MNGEAVKIKGEIVRCYLLTDRSTVIALTDDGALFRTTVSDTEDRTTLAENVNKVNVVKDSGIIYTDTKNYQYRLKFGGVEPLKLGEDLAMAVADDTLSLMYADGDGNICLLPEDEEEPEKSQTGSRRLFRLRVFPTTENSALDRNQQGQKRVGLLFVSRWREDDADDIEHLLQQRDNPL